MNTKETKKMKKTEKAKVTNKAKDGERDRVYGGKGCGVDIGGEGCKRSKSTQQTKKAKKTKEKIWVSTSPMEVVVGDFRWLNVARGSGTVSADVSAFACGDRGLGVCRHLGWQVWSLQLAIRAGVDGAGNHIR
ncbi:hypothetical protein CAPTEDRAFT_209420 [Capitella teleta]|uniref:Uncharacterized protein n=1 Tax=Capitella teleta TaxID=283909 RepID=R7UX10_CAPTE|nr:hypothetical protein CAPTEDRAFT_209420 [Capitella teleta]|eukprot:ELU11123.1 hypothetical protein CAPTEDRAFT_209420 [Capitella teleta]